MTPPQKKLHLGKIKTTADQVSELASAVRKLNVESDAEVEVSMGFGRVMEVRVFTPSRIEIAQMKCALGGKMEINLSSSPPAA